LAGLLVFSGLLVVVHVRAYTVLSPVDELQHADYLIKASHGELVRRGDPVGLTALQEAACRGIAIPVEAAPDCKTSTVVPDWLRDQRVNSEELQPPTYYFVTGAAARVIRPVIGSSSLVTAGRVAGAAWLMGGVLVLWGIFALLDVPVLARVAVTLLVVSTPVVLHASATINNDTTALVAGGGVLLAALAWEKGRVPWFVVPIAAVIAVALKVTNVIGVGAVVVYLLVRVLPREPDLSRRLLAGMAVGVTAAVGVVGLAWVAWHDNLARAGPLANPNIARFQTGSLALSQVLGQLDAGVTPIRDVAHVVFLNLTVLTAAVLLLNWLLLGASVGAATFGARASRAEALGIGALVAIVATGPLFVISNYVSLSMFASIPGRYALSAVPVLAVVLALSLRKQWVLGVVGALALVTSATTFIAVAMA
jgi:hypothetical protein